MLIIVCQKENKVPNKSQCCSTSIIPIKTNVILVAARSNGTNNGTTIISHDI